MPKPLTEQSVRDFLRQHGCILLSSYTTSNSQLTIQCACGHERVSTFSRIKLWNQYLCKKCTLRNRYRVICKKKSRLSSKQLRKMDVLFKRKLLYRKDFGENYGIMILCFTCKRMIPSYLFNNDPRKVNKKRSSCKKCMAKDNIQRRKKWTLEQFVQNMLCCTRSSAKRRRKRQRICSFSLSLEDIQLLRHKQGNRCVYSGLELEWYLNAPNKASIDRINSEEGYHIANIQLTIWRANEMKKDMSENIFLWWVLKIAEYHGTMPSQRKIEVIKRTYSNSETRFLRSRLNIARSSAKIRQSKGRECEYSLSEQDIVSMREHQNNRCVYSGVVLQWCQNTTNQASIDRIDSTKGYHIDNIQLVAWQVNQMKSDMTHDEFLRIIRTIAEYQQKK